MPTSSADAAKIGGNADSNGQVRASEPAAAAETAAEQTERAQRAEHAESALPEPGPLRLKLAERVSRIIGKRELVRLAATKGNVSSSLDDLPKRMHRVANQTRLVLQLIDDFVDGTYRAIPWRSVVVIAVALLYTVSPGDVIPDVLPFLGAIDDLAVIAFATRFVRKDLEAYCRFKHYSVEAYFG